jgi:type II secretory pathway predicted ATPase ExeA/pSer/pThr/pTyr-binding forkhead associated (FHA) protein
MYLQRFGLSTLPFRLSPDTAFLYPSLSHAHALEALRAMVAGPGGVTVMTGPAGVGKTTLIDRLLLDLPVSTAVARLNQGLPSTIALLQGLLIQFGYAPYHLTRSELGSALHTFLAERERVSARTLIIVDEAQRLDSEALLELLRAATPSSARLDVLLVGDPTLLERLESDDLSAFRAAISGRIRLSPLRPDELSHYLQHRLDTAGAAGRRLFDDTASDMLMRVTGGLPKYINKLADGAMAAAYEDARDHVRTDDVLAASRLLGTLTHTQNRSAPPPPPLEPATAAPSPAPPELSTQALPEHSPTPPSPDTARAQTPAMPATRPAQATAPPVPETSPEARAHYYRVHLRYEGTQISTVSLHSNEFSIGRTRENDLQIESRYVSRRHCRLLLEDGAVTIEDLDSTNGIRMNGEPIWMQPLKSGDEVQIGMHTLVLERVDADA